MRCVAGKRAATTPAATVMNGDGVSGQSVREPVLDVVDRVSEMLFGLFMALTFVGAVSVAEAGQAEVRATLASAVGCNLAWGLADAVMYLVRTITARGKWLTLVRSVKSASSPEEGRQLIEVSLARTATRLVSQAEIEAIRGRVVALPGVPDRPRVERGDLLGALGVFLIVVASTFPVVLPFVLVRDVGTAKAVSRAIALVMLFLGGAALGRYAGYGGWKAGASMTALGAALVVAIMALGG